MTEKVNPPPWTVPEWLLKMAEEHLPIDRKMVTVRAGDLRAVMLDALACNGHNAEAWDRLNDAVIGRRTEP